MVRWVVFFAVLVLLPLRALAWEEDVLRLRELVFTYKNYAWMNPQARSPLLYPEFPNDGLELDMKLSWLRYVYTDWRAHAVTTSSQFRGVGLEVRAGVSLTKFLDVGIWHHSQHIMEGEHGFIPRFPVEDRVEIRFFLKRDGSQRSLF